MDEDPRYVVAPPHKPPRRLPDTVVSGEWLAEKLDQLPTRKEMCRAVLGRRLATPGLVT
jgi:hypothetical protein